jgi:cytoplasmic iron level regulating protein YaaA (DUF328/UPF0246 family)
MRLEWDQSHLIILLPTRLLMLLLLSPAKTLDYNTPLPITADSQPCFVEQAQALINVLKAKSVEGIAALMGLSAKLAVLNVQRYAAWVASCTQENSRPAVFAFNGDVYEGLQAYSLSAAHLSWAQERVVILSGLYGALRPLDLIQPYRLEMGTRLETPWGKHLYEFWGTKIAAYLNERLAATSHTQGVDARWVVNLASEEYFKSINLQTLDARVVQCVFQDRQGVAWKVMGLKAKRARGLMARYVIQHKIVDPEQLQGFKSEGYAYDAAVSTADKLVFRRKP